LLVTASKASVCLLKCRGYSQVLATVGSAEKLAKMHWRTLRDQEVGGSEWLIGGSPKPITRRANMAQTCWEKPLPVVA
jgi:hypothetical protein